MSIKPHEFLVGLNDNGRRADRIVKILLPEIPLSQIYKLFRNGDIRIENVKIKPDYKVRFGEKLVLFFSDSSEMAHRPSAKNIPFLDLSAFDSNILFENDDLLFINKPRGVLSHGQGGLDAWAIAHFQEKITQSLAFTPAPLHRLDRNTSGVLIISASIEGARQFSSAMIAGLIKKRYLALIEGKLPKAQHWEDKLLRDTELKKSFVTDSCQGILASTHVEPLLTDGRVTLASILLDTGRTHQIRVQCAAHGFPLLGDKKYGGTGTESSYVLHAERIFFPDDFSILVPAVVKAPLPMESFHVLSELFGQKQLKNALQLLDIS